MFIICFLCFSHGGLGKYFFLKCFWEDMVLRVQQGSQAPKTTVVTSYRKQMKEDSSDQLFYVDDVTRTIREKRNDYCLEISGKLYLFIRGFQWFGDIQFWKLATLPFLFNLKCEKLIDASSGFSIYQHPWGSLACHWGYDLMTKGCHLSGHPSHYVSSCIWVITHFLYVPRWVCYPLGHIGRYGWCGRL